MKFVIAFIVGASAGLIAYIISGSLCNWQTWVVYTSIVTAYFFGKFYGRRELIREVEKGI